MAIHSSSNIFAWRIPWTEEPGRLQSMGSQRRHKKPYKDKASRRDTLGTLPFPPSPISRRHAASLELWKIPGSPCRLAALPTLEADKAVAGQGAKGPARCWVRTVSCDVGPAGCGTPSLPHSAYNEHRSKHVWA